MDGWMKDLVGVNVISSIAYGNHEKVMGIIINYKIWYKTQKKNRKSRHRKIKTKLHIGTLRFLYN